MKAQKFKKNNFVGVCDPSGVVTSKNKIDLEISEQLLKEYNLNVKYSKIYLLIL